MHRQSENQEKKHLRNFREAGQVVIEAVVLFWFFSALIFICEIQLQQQEQSQTTKKIGGQFHAGKK